MRILRIAIDGAQLYQGKRFELDLFATDRVVCAQGAQLPEDVCRVGNAGSVYSLNAIGLSGVNASGKTTSLMLLESVMALLSEPALVRHNTSIKDGVSCTLDENFSIEVVFWHEGQFYLLQSNLAFAGEERRGGSDIQRLPADARFTDERLWQLEAPARVIRKQLASADQFIAGARLLIHRAAQPGQPGALNADELRFLKPGESVVSSVVGADASYAETLLASKLPSETLPSAVVQAFDPSIEYLRWDEAGQVFHLKFKGEAVRPVSREKAAGMLSTGTINGAGLVTHSIDVLRCGGCMLVDELETCLNRALVGTVIELFTSPVTNPHGAQLVFTTHDPALLDMLHRKDSVYLLVRDEGYRTQVVKYSARVKRIENKKSEVVLSNMVRGTMPRYPDVRAMREYVKEQVNA